MQEPIWLYRWLWGFGAVILAFTLAVLGLHEAQAQEKKPNILVIFGEDIGQSNISIYTKGSMGYKTPNIDRIATEGMMFTDY
jgi:arylsulfatase